jgi:hypothetical protein
MPSRIFADTDILSLIQTFEASDPWTPKNETPPLISNFSITHLIPTTHLVARLAQVLSEPDRKTALSKSLLADILEIDESNLQVVLQASRHEIHVNARGEILPGALLQRITSTLRELVDSRVVDLTAFAKKYNLDVEVLKKLVQGGLSQWRHFASDKQGELYCSAEVSHDIRQILSRHMNEAASSASKVDVSAISEFADYSTDVIMAIIRDAGDDITKGAFQIEDGRVVFVPSAFAQAEQERLWENLNSRVEEVLDRVDKNGICGIDSGDLALRNALTTGRASGDVELLFAPNSDVKAARGSSARQGGHVVLRTALETSLESLKSALDDTIQAKWTAGERKLDHNEMLRGLSSDLPRDQSQLGKLIIDSGRYSSELEAHLRSKIITLEAGDQETYLKSLVERLLIPIHLYSSGLEIVQDEALRTRLSNYACSHLLGEIPSLADDLKARHLLTGIRERDFAKFRTTAAELKEVTALQSAATKLTKKAKWDAQPLSPLQVRQVKTKVLQRTVHAMRPSSTVRPSDVLQHALWILLGVASEGVFISAGKDTSRMIALYESVPGGDATMVEELKVLRDKLKKGEAADKEVGEMREAVKGCIDRFVEETWEHRWT